MSILSFLKFINKKQMAKNKIAICFFDMKNIDILKDMCLDKYRTLL